MRCTPLISVIRKPIYHNKYIGIIDDTMGILTRNIDFLPSYRKTLQSPRKEKFVMNSSYKVPEKELLTGIPNPERYNAPIINSYLNTSRLPFFRGIRHREKDYKSLERVNCKRPRVGLKGYKITSRLLMSLKKEKKVIRKNLPCKRKSTSRIDPKSPLKQESKHCNTSLSDQKPKKLRYKNTIIFLRSRKSKEKN